MKKSVFYVTMLVAMLLASCEVPEGNELQNGDWQDRLEDLEGRVEALEEFCDENNKNISSLKTLVDVLNSKDMIEAVIPLTSGDQPLGYAITFSKRDAIIIYSATAKGEIPMIGVREKNGIYYWTLDSEWLLDNRGEKLPVTGKDGTNGEKGDTGVTPQLKIENGFWWVSYDGKTTWEKLGTAISGNEQSGNSNNGECVIADVTDNGSSVNFTLADGTVITIAKNPDGPDTNAVFTITYKANGGEGEDVVNNVPYGRIHYIGFEGWGFSVYSEIGFVREGYVLVSWNTAADGSGETYQLHDREMLVSLKDITLYAQWSIYEITKIESVDWRQLYNEEAAVMTEVEIETSSKNAPAPIVLTALGNPSVVDHLVGGYRFGIVGEEGYLDYSKTSIENEYIRLESTSETREGGKVGIRGLKSGTVQIWVEIGDAALGGNFTLEKYGEPKRAILTVHVLDALGLKVYKEGNMSTEIGTSCQTMTVGDNQVFVAQIEDAEAHELFKNNIEWIVEDNYGGAISINLQDPTDKTRVTVTANSAAKGNDAPKLYAKVTDAKGKETVSAMFRIEVEEAASDEASNLEFTSAVVRWEDFYYFGSDYYTYVFTTAAGDELVIPASDPDMMGMGYNAYMFDEDRTWTIGENGDEDIFIMSGQGIGITISASGTEYRIQRGTITISGRGTSAQIDLMAVPIVGGVEGTVTPVTGTWSGTKPADPRP